MRELRSFIACIVIALAVLAPASLRAQEAAWFGATTQSVTPELMREHGLILPHGAVVGTVEAGSPAAAADLRRGDVILYLNGTQIRSRDDVLSVLAPLRPGTQTEVVRMRDGQAAKVSVTLAAKAGGPAAAPVIVSTSAAPQLMLDTGGHMAMIRKIIYSADGTQLISASDDKVIRIWDLASGKTVRTIRGEVGPGDVGKVFAMAISPDGKWLAAGGYVGPYVGDKPDRADEEAHKIRLYDFATGEMKALLKGHHNGVLSLAFTTDSKRLVSGSFDGRGLIWDVASRSIYRELKGHTAAVFAVGVTPDGRHAITGAYDKIAMLWRLSDGGLVAKMEGHPNRIRSIAVSRDGTIATGDLSGEIRLWDGKNGRFIKTLSKQPTEVGSLSFSPDGTRILSSVTKSATSTHPYGAHIFEIATGRQISFHKDHINNVLATAYSPDGKWAATAGGSDAEVNIWNPNDGKLRQQMKGTGRPVWTVGLSPDGGTLMWGNTWKYHDPANGYADPEYRLVLPVKVPRLGRPEKLDAVPAKESLVRAIPSMGSLSLAHVKTPDFGFDEILEVREGNAAKASMRRVSTDGYQHRSYTFTRDGKTIISGGGNGALLAYDLKGNKLPNNFIGHENDIWAVTPSPDGRLLFTGSHDQTVRVWNVATRELIATLFYGQNNEWVIWTPQGFYTGSPGGGALVGWQINKGYDKAGEYVRGQQLREQLHRPDIVTRAIQLASAEAAAREAGMGDFRLSDLLRRSPPQLTVDGPGEATGGRVVLTVAFERNQLTPSRVDIFVNDTKVTTKTVALPAGAARAPDGGSVEAYEVPLYKGNNFLRIIAANDVGESEPQGHAVYHPGEGALDTRGTLHVLAVGVDKYPAANQFFDDLTYAGKDAEAIAATVAREMGPAHAGTPNITVLVNGKGAAQAPTKANIEAALKKLERSAGDRDTVVVFLAGHGENWAGGRYHFLPTDFKRTKADEPGENIIDWSMIQGTVTRTKGRKVLFVDACHSGNAYNAKLTADARADRFVAFAATSGDGKAWEFRDLGQGAFTYVLIEGLKGKAEDPGERAVTVYRLGTYVYEEVKKRTRGQQEPEYNSGLGNFVLKRL